MVVTLVVALILGGLLTFVLLLLKLVIGASLGLKLFKLLSEGCVPPVEPEIGSVLLVLDVKFKELLFIGD